jgi:hypothetical protein
MMAIFLPRTGPLLSTFIFEKNAHSHTLATLTVEQIGVATRYPASNSFPGCPDPDWGFSCVSHAGFTFLGAERVRE